jgi:hypothetical protein
MYLQKQSMRMHCELSFYETVPEICSVGQIWTTLCLMKHQKKSMRTYSKLPFDYSLSDETSEGVYDYVNKVNVQKLFGQDVQQVILELTICMVDETLEVYESDSTRRRNFNA